MTLCDICNRTGYRFLWDFKVRDYGKSDKSICETGYQIDLCEGCLQKIKDVTRCENNAPSLTEIFRKVLCESTALEK